MSLGPLTSDSDLNCTCCTRQKEHLCTDIMHLSEATDVVELALERFQTVVFLPRFREGRSLKGRLKRSMALLGGSQKAGNQGLSQ